MDSQGAEDGQKVIELTDVDFQRIYKEVYAFTNWVPQHAYILPLLLDELDLVKHRKAEEPAKIKSMSNAELVPSTATEGE
jgi:hypothetical protein